MLIVQETCRSCADIAVTPTDSSFSLEMEKMQLVKKLFYLMKKREKVRLLKKTFSSVKY